MTGPVNHMKYNYDRELCLEKHRTIDEKLSEMKTTLSHVFVMCEIILAAVIGSLVTVAMK